MIELTAANYQHRMYEEYGKMFDALLDLRNHHPEAEGIIDEYLSTMYHKDPKDIINGAKIRDMLNIIQLECSAQPEQKENQNGIIQEGADPLVGVAHQPTG